MNFVVARTAKGRPTLQHVTKDYETTACGLDITYWSRGYSDYPIRQILCKKCERHI